MGGNRRDLAHKKQRFRRSRVERGPKVGPAAACPSRGDQGRHPQAGPEGGTWGACGGVERVGAKLYVALWIRGPVTPPAKGWSDRSLLVKAVFLLLNRAHWEVRGQEGMD